MWKLLKTVIIDKLDLKYRGQNVNMRSRIDEHSIKNVGNPLM